MIVCDYVHSKSRKRHAPRLLVCKRSSDVTVTNKCDVTHHVSHRSNKEQTFPYKSPEETHNKWYNDLVYLRQIQMCLLDLCTCGGGGGVSTPPKKKKKKRKNDTLSLCMAISYRLQTITKNITTSTLSSNKPFGKKKKQKNQQLTFIHPLICWKIRSETEKYANGHIRIQHRKERTNSFLKHSKRHAPLRFLNQAWSRAQ